MAGCWCHNKVFACGVGVATIRFLTCVLVVRMKSPYPNKRASQNGTHGRSFIFVRPASASRTSCPSSANIHPVYDLSL